MLAGVGVVPAESRSGRRAGPGRRARRGDEANRCAGRDRAAGRPAVPARTAGPNGSAAIAIASPVDVAIDVPVEVAIDVAGICSARPARAAIRSARPADTAICATRPVHPAIRTTWPVHPAVHAAAPMHAAAAMHPAPAVVTHSASAAPAPYLREEVVADVGRGVRSHENLDRFGLRRDEACERKRKQSVLAMALPTHCPNLL